jgi:predicted amidophosphoribosyltransferase
MWDLWLDLALGSTCAACGAPGRALCRDCAAELPSSAHETCPDPCPPGLVPVRAAGEYAGAVRALVVAHKERRRLALAGPLGGMLATAVERVVLDLAPDRPGPVWLVPVPSRRAVVAARGHDPLTRMSRASAAVLRDRGMATRLLPLLHQVSRPLDQSGLSADARRENLFGRFGVRGVPVPPGQLVLVDDVVTTGATLREAQRALEVAGHPVLGAATVAATRRRGRESDPSFPSSPKGASV